MLGNTRELQPRSVKTCRAHQHSYSGHPILVIRFLPPKFRIQVDFTSTNYFGDTPEPMPKFSAPDPQTVKVGMTTDFGLVHEERYSIAYGFEPVYLRTSTTKLYEVADVGGKTRKQEHGLHASSPNWNTRIRTEDMYPLAGITDLLTLTSIRRGFAQDLSRVDRLTILRRS